MLEPSPSSCPPLTVVSALRISMMGKRGWGVGMDADIRDYYARLPVLETNGPSA